MNLLADAGSIHAGFTLPGAVAFQSNVAIHCANFKSSSSQFWATTTFYNFPTTFAQNQTAQEGMKWNQSCMKNVMKVAVLWHNRLCWNKMKRSELKSPRWNPSTDKTIIYSWIRNGKQLWQHRTILSVEPRRQIFVTVVGKSASETTLKASAVNCAVLPYMLRSSVLSNCGWQHFDSKLLKNNASLWRMTEFKRISYRFSNAMRALLRVHLRSALF